MRTTRQLSITLPNELTGAVKAKVASGNHVTESEVIGDGQRRLMARDRAVKRWLHKQAGPAYDALNADGVRDPGVTGSGRLAFSGQRKSRTIGESPSGDLPS